MGRKSKQKLYAFVDALVEIGAKELVKTLGTPEDKASEVMRQVAHGVCFRYARTILYVPADLEFSLTQRDQDIWAKYGQDGADGAGKYTPMRVAQLGQEYQLTVAHIYQILRLMQRREIAARQGSLPGFEAVEDGQPG